MHSQIPGNFNTREVYYEKSLGPDCGDVVKDSILHYGLVILPTELASRLLKSMTPYSIVDNVNLYVQEGPFIIKTYTCGVLERFTIDDHFLISLGNGNCVSIERSYLWFFCINDCIKDVGYYN